MSPGLDAGTQRLLRDLTPEVLGALMRRSDDLAACEDAVQEALLAAAERWPLQGVPRKPRGWLIRVASRRMLDHLRSEDARRDREAAVAEEAPAIVEGPGLGPPGPGGDDSLALLFMCCHESLTPASAIALTLRAVGGLTTREIASAFMVPTATMGQRISRAKGSIRDSGVPFRVPPPEERARYLPTVLHVLYLMFNEGYASSLGPNLQREELSREAIHLARMVRRELPEDPEVAGPLALMLLTDARRPARTGAHGELVPLAEQDRSLWREDLIEEGVALVDDAFSRGRVGQYQIQAAVAALHDQAASVEDTDWPQILALYGVLERVAESPMVTLSRAVAVAMVHGPEVALQILESLDDEGRLEGHHRLEAVRGHLLDMADRPSEARIAYELAAGRADNIPERDYLLLKVAELGNRTRHGETLGEGG
ncbi:MAG: sigma factor [Gemmatimonadota bacterium]